MKKYSELVDGGNYKAWHYFEKFKMTLYDEKVLKILKWASSRQNLSSGFPTKPDSNQSPQLQRLARKLELRS